METEVEVEPIEISKTLSTKPKKTQQSIKKQIKPVIIEDSTSREQLIEQRKLDDNEIRFTNICSEWTVAHKDMQTQSSERDMNKHYEQYQDYIKSGLSPRSN